MKYEQRLLLAIAATAGILLVWSLLSPPPSTQHAVPPSSPVQADWIKPAGTEEPKQEFTLGQHQLKIGAQSGGIVSWSQEGEWILDGAAPGFLELRGVGKQEPVSLETIEEAGRLISRGTLPEELSVRREIAVPSEKYPNLLDCQVAARNNSSREQEVSLRLAVYKPLVDHGTTGRQHFATGTVWSHGKPQELKVKPGQTLHFEGMPDWVVSQGRFDAIVVEPQAVPGMFHVEHLEDNSQTGWIEMAAFHLRPGEEKTFSLRVYGGPAVLKELKKVGMEEALFFGTFSDITRLLLRFLSWSHDRLHSYGWAIALLSFSVWLPFAPLSWYGMKISQQTMQRMTALKPQEARIRREHKNNPQKVQQELMQLYRKHKVNPASGCLGCLPLLLTWPIYIALFQVLNRAPELHGAAFLWIRDLSSPDALIRFPQTVPLLGAGLNVLPLISTGLFFLQQKFMQRPGAEMTEEQKVQQQMMKIMPIVLLAVFYQMPSGFMLYWVINSALMAGQQLLLARSATPAAQA